MALAASGKGVWSQGLSSSTPRDAAAVPRANVEHCTSTLRVELCSLKRYIEALNPIPVNVAFFADVVKLRRGH